jgi:adenine phosphoribosyltransferase
LDSIEIHSDAITSDDVVLIHDDLLATGGSMNAAYDLVQLFHPKDVFINFIIELRIEGLKGREALGEDKKVTSLLTITE